MEIRLQIDNAAEITAAFANAPDMVLDEMAVTMRSLMLYLMRETQEAMLERDVIASGHLRQSWYTEVNVVGMLDAVFGRLTNPLPYALPVEMGSKPHFPPIEPLINWVEQKLHLYGDEAETAARGIQRKIGARGTLARGMVHAAFAGVASTAEAEFTECAQRIKARLVAAAGGAGGAVNGGAPA
jgi:hypothetical protein